MGLLFVAMMVRTLFIPLQGIHEWRQADTLFAGYFYCTENTNFFKPHIGPREGTSGFAVGELPLFSYILSLKCKATGHWDEVTPKLICYVIFFLVVFLWGLFFFNQEPKEKKNWWIWGALFAGAPISLMYLPLPIPDGFSLATIALSGLLWQRSKKSFDFYSWLAIIIFFITFLIRPYYVPLLFLVSRERRQQLVTLALCSAGYLVWFLYWVPQSEMYQYYGTKLRRPPAALLKEIPAAFPELLWKILRDHFNFLGLIFFVKGARKHRFLLGLWAASLLLIISLRGDHFVIHSYYLFAGALISFYLMYEGYFLSSQKWRDWVIALMLILALAAIQHQWAPKRNNLGIELREKVWAVTRATDHVVIYMGPSPEWMYHALRAGWSLAPELYKGPEMCPEKVQFSVRQVRGS